MANEGLDHRFFVYVTVISTLQYCFSLQGSSLTWKKHTDVQQAQSTYLMLSLDYQEARWKL